MPCDPIATDPWTRCPTKALQEVWIDLMLKIGCQYPFPNEARLPLEKLQQLSCMFASCRLTTGWWGVCRPDPNDVLIEVLRCGQWLGQDPIPVQLEEPAYYLFH
jgi:hypothetical protein